MLPKPYNFHHILWPQVLKALGKGSYGTVYKVQRMEDGGVYAMKETDLTRMGAKERQDAVNEIRVLGSMKHPNVVKHHETFVSGGQAAITAGQARPQARHVHDQQKYMQQGTEPTYTAFVPITIDQAVICADIGTCPTMPERSSTVTQRQQYIVQAVSCSVKETLGGNNHPMLSRPAACAPHETLLLTSNHSSKQNPASAVPCADACWCVRSFPCCHVLSCQATSCAL